MKGVSFVTDGHNNKKAVIIDLKLFSRFDEEMEDFIDGLIAESRENEPKIPLDKVIKKLKKAGKLK